MTKEEQEKIITSYLAYGSFKRGEGSIILQKYSKEELEDLGINATPSNRLYFINAQKFYEYASRHESNEDFDGAALAYTHFYEIDKTNEEVNEKLLYYYLSRQTVALSLKYLRALATSTDPKVIKKYNFLLLLVARIVKLTPDELAYVNKLTLEDMIDHEDDLLEVKKRIFLQNNLEALTALENIDTGSPFLFTTAVKSILIKIETHLHELDARLKEGLTEGLIARPLNLLKMDTAKYNIPLKYQMLKMVLEDALAMKKQKKVFTPRKPSEHTLYEQIKTHNYYLAKEMPSSNDTLLSMALDLAIKTRINLTLKTKPSSLEKLEYSLEEKDRYSALIYLGDFLYAYGLEEYFYYFQIKIELILKNGGNIKRLLDYLIVLKKRAFVINLDEIINSFEDSLSLKDYESSRLFLRLLSGIYKKDHFIVPKEEILKYLEDMSNSLSKRGIGI